MHGPASSDRRIPKPRGLEGPYTHWHPSGAVESHGTYVADEPDGVWGFWYPDGARKSVGRYDRGRPIGCFAVWDEQGTEITGIVDGDQVRVAPCAPPVAALVAIEMRSHPVDTRETWGDLAFRAAAEGGRFGVENPTQADRDPAALATLQFGLRKYIGDLRAGMTLAYRASDSDDVAAYVGGITAGYRLPLPTRRISLDVELQLGVQYVDVAAHHPDGLFGTASFWMPNLGARLALAVAVTPTIEFVGGPSVEGAPSYTASRSLRYCAGGCDDPVLEIWRLGAMSYGFELGVRLRLR